MGSTNRIAGQTFSPPAAPAGHKTATHTTAGIRCVCGQSVADRAQLAAHHQLAAWGVR